jgi:hypothetical protein
MVVDIPINGKNVRFEGPCENAMNVPETAGIFLVLCYQDSINFSYLDVGAVKNPRKVLEKHTRKERWRKNCTGIIKYAFQQIPDFKSEKREDYIEDIIDEHNPICYESS